MHKQLYRLLFILFLLSGFCGLLYQVVWVRMAYAAFGVITPVLSVVISVFMLGLSIGSWAGGKLIARFCASTGKSAIFFYGVAEIAIGFGALLVPLLFSFGSDLLLSSGEMDSAGYLFFSALALCGAILPWCVFMGFTFPFMMAYIQEVDARNETGFSYLYFANVVGAMLGTLVTAVVLIEVFGFKTTLLIAGGLNFSIAAISFIIGARKPAGTAGALPDSGPQPGSQAYPVLAEITVPACWLLFATGLISMAMEVVWIRGFTPVLQTRTYSFASLLAVYLMATWIGSFLYRKQLAQGRTLSTQKVLTGLAAFALLPIIMNDPRLQAGIPAALGSIIPFCAALGYLTPKLIDQYSIGNPDLAGRAYAFNIIGCIIGPLFASYVLLPTVGVKVALLILAAPFPLFVLIRYRATVFTRDWSIVLTTLALCFFFYASVVNVSYEEVYAAYRGNRVRREHTATVVAHGTGFNKMLLVNGIGITQLTPVTKNMAHLPLAFLKEKPRSALVICFGMGTTFRSLLSWDIDATAVELVPSVKELFGYYFADAPALLANPRGRIVIDDGRRFLKRTTQRFDVITIDPPPPVEAAGSSLLYSREFYQLVKDRLSEKGILHHWFPFGELRILNAVARSLASEFPHIKVYKSTSGWGTHFICSLVPLDSLSVVKMVARMPDTAQKDLVEWHRSKDINAAVAAILSQEIALADLLVADEKVVVTDDQPYNEYYVLRRQFARMAGTYRIVR